MAKLTEKQRKFVEAYMISGNATDAARQVGYKNPNTQGPRLLVNVGIRQEIDKRVKHDPAVWGRKELMKFWTEMSKDAKKDSDRIKASELLAKSEAMFVQKVEVNITEGKSHQEMLEGAAEELRKAGWKVEPPE